MRHQDGNPESQQFFLPILPSRVKLPSRQMDVGSRTNPTSPGEMRSTYARSQAVKGCGKSQRGEANSRRGPERNCSTAPRIRESGLLGTMLTAIRSVTRAPTYGPTAHSPTVE